MAKHRGKGPKSHVPYSVRRCQALLCKAASDKAAKLGLVDEYVKQAITTAVLRRTYGWQ